MRQMLVATLLAVSLTAVGANSFRVTPYVQHPKPTAMSLLWLAQTNGAARVEVWKDGAADVRILEAVEDESLSADVTGGRFTADDVLQYCRAPELDYVNSVESVDNYPAYTRENTFAGWSMPYTAPYQYRVRLTGLEADTLYRYRVTLDGNGATYENRFRTSPDSSAWRGFKFIYFSDSETEPADNPDSTGRTPDWSEPGSADTNHERTYLATQTECYASNLCAAVKFGTELIVMAGDLAQKGSRQCDWDEFWRHNAGQLNDHAGSIPILASPGNHDYWSYNDDGTVATRKYLSYFEYEKNGAAVDADQQERFHRVDYGPVTFIFLDANNGDDSDKSKDTNHSISTAHGCRAPDFNPGTAQYQWLEAQLRDAQKNSAFTFIVTHQCPFSVGHHGRDTGHDTLSGQPLRVLLPLMHKYGVDGWLAGHDEMMERAITEGVETLPDGKDIPHSFFVWDMGIAGDGLRGCRLYDGNTNEQYRADVDSPEVYENGVLIEGGKHYGHLEVTIDQAEDGSWRATFDPVYIFYSQDANGNPVYGGVRHYADKVVRVSNRCKGAPPAQGVTAASVDCSHYAPTKMPQGLVTTFWNGPLTRGFAWQTDTSITETKLWLLKGEYDQDDGNTFVRSGTLHTGEHTTVDDPAMNCHRVHTDVLEPGATYSYRFGGNGYYAYGRLTVNAPAAPLVAVNFNDVQTKDATLLYKAENTLATAARTVGGAVAVDFLLNGGDFIDLNYFNNADSVYGSIGYRKMLYWKWGVSADTMMPYFPGVPMVSATGIHDAAQYTACTAVDYGFTASHGGGGQAVDYGNVHVAAIPYPGEWDAADAQFMDIYRWLDDDLRTAKDATWKVVCLHWGPYTTGDHACLDTSSLAMTRLLTPMLASNHVDLVLQAHDHTYSKTVPYRWDALGYTSNAGDASVLNLAPEKRTVNGIVYDFKPCGTYYASIGCCGHRVGASEDGFKYANDKGYATRNPVIAIGATTVASKYKALGADSSGDFGRQMFGVLKVENALLSYEFYVAEEDGTATLVDRLGICKQVEEGNSKSGMSVILR